MTAKTDPRYFTAEHIEKHRFNAPAGLAEEAVHCLELVAEMVEAGLQFQFKGGNSLLLILPEPKRFSIDVDIATDAPREKIEQCLDAIVSRYRVFKRWEKRQHKTKPWLPIASYYLNFDSIIKHGAETSIMLDAQLRRSPYKTEKRPVACGELYKSETLAELPLPSSIIGDKLLTLGPNTLGIPVGKGKEAQRLKHVFDVSRLLAVRPSLAEIRESFFACLRHENEIQERRPTADEVIADTIAFCRSVAPYAELPPEKDLSPVMSENVRGLPLFAGHLFDAGYSWNHLRRDTERVGACVEAIQNNAISDQGFLSRLDELPLM
ncbi:MAG: nucleotidyl transferase AbiEii/AbiGii toxin family protein [Chitinispirillaceae bacterium]|nr:nucleotidyl transferase AbiEii/AbiGii toxin family protein [Chitinispirillaceae bacterium]